MSDQAWIEWILGDSERKKLGSLENEWKQNAICSIENIPTKVFYPERKRGDVAAAFLVRFQEKNQIAFISTLKQDDTGNSAA